MSRRTIRVPQPFARSRGHARLDRLGRRYSSGPMGLIIGVAEGARDRLTGGGLMNEGSMRDNLSQGAGDSADHRRLVRAVSKANGDPHLARRNVGRLFNSKFDALPPSVRTAAERLIAEAMVR